MMPAATPMLSHPATVPRSAVSESNFIRRLLIGAALSFIGLFLVVPLIAVFSHAFEKGWRPYWAAFKDPVTLSAIRLTLLTAAIVVPLNTVFGVAAAWALAKFRFRGRNLIITLIDLPFSVSPVIAGLIYVLVFGSRGWLGPWLEAREITIIFALPGIILATTFVTFSFVARELIPLMQVQGTDEEETAISLGANG